MIKIAIPFLSVSCSRNINVDNKIVVNGLAKNRILETIGFVIFNPKKLKSKARKIIRDISMTLKK